MSEQLQDFRLVFQFKDSSPQEAWETAKAMHKLIEAQVSKVQLVEVQGLYWGVVPAPTEGG